MLDRHNRPAIEALIDENEDEELVSKNDPCHYWIHIEDVADPDSLGSFYEITPKPEEEIEEIGTIQDFEDGGLIEFEEIEDGNRFGKIISASINTETGVITLHREEIPSETLAIGYTATGEKIFADDEFESFYPRILGKKVLQDYIDYDLYEERKTFKRTSHDNLKTMPASKTQRMRRKQLRAIRLKF